ERSTSVSSMRRMNAPPVERAKAQGYKAERILPRWMNPVGEGAKRVRVVMTPAFSQTALFLLDARAGDDLVPLLRFGGLELAQFVGRAGQRLESVLRVEAGDGRALVRLGEDVVQLRDDGRGGAGGHVCREPEAHLVAFHAGFGDRRQFRRERNTLGRRHAEGLHLSRLRLRQARG